MSVESMYQEMKSKLERVVPDFELRYKAELAEEINQLKKRRTQLSWGITTWSLRYIIPSPISEAIRWI